MDIAGITKTRDKLENSPFAAIHHVGSLDVALFAVIPALPRHPSLESFLVRVLACCLLGRAVGYAVGWLTGCM